MTCEDCIHNEVCYRREVCNDIEEHIKKLGCMDFIARADVQAVKHGEWIKYYLENAIDGLYFCSACFKEQDIADGMITPLDIGYHYCPNCGAKMDGGKNDDSRKSVRASE